MYIYIEGYYWDEYRILYTYFSLLNLLYEAKFNCVLIVSVEPTKWDLDHFTWFIDK